MGALAKPPAGEAALMAVTLALLEVAVAFGAATAIVFLAAGESRWPLLASAAAHGLALALCLVAGFYLHDLYDLRRVRTFRRSVRRLPQAAGAGALMLVAAHAPFVHCPIPGRWLVAGGLAAVALVLVPRAAAYRLLESRRYGQRVVIVGGGPLAEELAAEFQARPELRQTVVGFVEDGSGTSVSGCPRLGASRDLARIVADVRPQRVIVALASRRGKMPLKALFDLRLRGIRVEDGVEVYEKLTGKIAIEAITPSSVIFCAGFCASRLDLALGRAVSVPVAALGLFLLAPLFGLVALAIKLESAGPLFFTQDRVGRGGRRFRLVKFRTMRPARSSTSEWARDNHDRLTRVGDWLRRFRLDELPQLVSILKGDMNLVGPRPHPVSNVPLFAMVMRNAPECGEPIPYYALRSMVRPGLTGWAQVRYHYANDLEEEVEKMRYDLYYIKHMSAWLDLRILFETFKIVLHGRELASEEAPPRRPEAPALRRVVPVLRPGADGSRASVAVVLAHAEPRRAAAEFEGLPVLEPAGLRRPVTGR